MNNALRELLPRRARLALYVLAGTGAAALAAWTAAGGDWAAFAGSVLAFVASATAGANLTPPAPTEDA
jgi:hypothetical protein